MIRIVQRELESRILGNRRTVWVQPGGDAQNGLCVFLDGEYYLAHIRAAGIVQRLQQEGTMPRQTVAYVSSIDADTRWAESFCNADFASFLATELVPWLGGEGANTLVGLSLTGLAAAHAALRHPDVFAKAVCQSASFWWKDGWLAANVPEGDVAFRISVGLEETNADVDHGNGLVQRASQLASNREMREALRAGGHSVSYAEFAGGHDIASWRRDLPESLGTI